MQIDKRTGMSGIAIVLSLLCLVSVRPTRAQTLSLQSGDTVAVTGAGTTGVYQGQAVSSGTHTYSTGMAYGTDVSVPAGAAFTLGSGALLDGGPPDGSMVTALLVQGGTATVTGGTVAGGQPYGRGLQLTGGSVDMTGGTVSGARAFVISGGLLRVSGGTVNGQFYGFDVSSVGTVDLFGAFTDGNGNALTAPITTGGGTVQGTFLDGSVLAKTTYFVGQGGVLEFNVGPAPAPEPAQCAALGMGTLALAGLTLRSRRRKGSVR